MFNWLKNRALPVVQKDTLIHYTTHGCQAQIREFNFVGFVVGTENSERTKHYSNEFYYLVKVSISDNVRYKEGEIVKVPAWYCTKLNNVIVFED